MTMKQVVEVGDPSNDGQSAVRFQEPYIVRAVVEGVAPFIFHRWSVDGVQAKADAAKGSKAKKTDDLESYVYRDERGHLAIPCEYFRMSIVNAAKFKQDPRSPRKSAMDLFKAGVAGLDEYCSLGKERWDYEDRRRVMVQRQGITRTRPAMHTGWRVELSLQVLLPEYINHQLLHEVLCSAGRLVGVGDFRPTFGRFSVVRFEVS